MLKSFLRLRAWLPTILFLAFVVWIVGWSSSFERCIDEQHYQERYKPHEENVSPFRIWMARHSDCTGHFIHENADAIIAVFTIFLVLSTILLWFATRDSVRSAEETSRQVNRAYLACGGDFDKTTRFFNLEVENNGQTPAFMLDYDVQTAMPGQVGMQRAIQVNRDHQHWKDTIPPRSRKTIGTRVTVPKNVAFVFGCVWYRDVWDKPHSTRFILSVRNDRTWPDATGVHKDYTETT
jgi:hypothetical protein